MNRHSQKDTHTHTSSPRPRSVPPPQSNDTLGMIANAHVALADQHPLGARCEGCLMLARKHSEAVDYPKTCIPVPLFDHERPKVGHAAWVVGWTP